MKHFINFMKYSLFLSLVVAMVSCGGDDNDDGDEEEDPRQETVDALTGTLSFNAVDKPTDATELDWSGLSITWTGSSLSGGDYTTSGSADETVWPKSGSWQFTSETSGAKITRDDGVVVTLAIGDGTQLETKFSIDTQAGRTMNVDGEWTFTFDF